MRKVLVLANSRSEDLLLCILTSILGQRDYSVIVDPVEAKEALIKTYFDVIILGSRQFDRHAPMLDFVDHVMTNIERERSIFFGFNEEDVERYSTKVRGSFLKAKSLDEEEMKKLFDELMS